MRILHEKVRLCSLPTEACASTPLKGSQRESVCFSDQFSFLKCLSVQVSVNIWNRLESNVLRKSGQGALGAVWSEGGLELGAGEMLRKPACGAVAGFADCAVGVRRSLGSQSRTGR